MRNALKVFTRAVLCVLAAAVLLTAGINGWVLLSAADRVETPEQAALHDAELIVVLGCGIRGNQPSPLLRDRLECAAALYEATGIPLLMSGGESEVRVMRRFAREAGVPEEDILTDPYGLSTYDSMHRLRSVYGVKTVLIVTQRYHLSRAVYIAGRLGIDAYGAVSDHTDFVDQFRRDVREVFARVKDFIWCVFKPLPAASQNG